MALTLNTHALLGQMSFAQVDYNWNQIQVQFNDLETTALLQIPPNNLTADRDPLPSDDFDAGFRELSRWFNTVNETLWVCIDPTVGDAVWIDSEFDVAGFGSAALADLGTGPNDVPQNSDLGAAAYLGVGPSAGQLLRRQDGDSLYLPGTTTVTDIGGGTASSFDEASNADVFTAEPSRTISAEVAATAVGYVALTDGAIVDVDCDEFINAEVTIAGNRTLGNPQNAVAGRTYAVLVKGNSGTSRTLSFAGQYGGFIPVLNDISSSKWYDITIKCIVPGAHFIVSASEASPP